MTDRGSELVRVDGLVVNIYHGGKHLVFSSVYRVLCSTVTFYAERCKLNYCFVANWLCGYLPVVGCLWLFSSLSRTLGVCSGFDSAPPRFCLI